MTGSERNRSDNAQLPTGTVTFLFTDIEGSTQLLEQLRERYAELLTDHHRIVRIIIAEHDGREVDTQGDAFFVAFARASDAIAAAVNAQRALAAHAWPHAAAVKVRMGLHTGETLPVMEGYVGMDIHRAARIAHIGHGGQVLLSETTSSLVRRDLPEGVGITVLGSFRLKDIGQPETISQLVIPDMEHAFPPLKADMIAPTQAITAPIRLPDFLREDEMPSATPLFVARQQELTWLQEKLAAVLQNRTQMIFITGEAGTGKTALIREFLHRMLSEHDHPLVALGQCNAYTGRGDPYLPFRQVLDMLCGDVEGRYLAGTISQDHARRLWEALPETAAVLAEAGPQLLQVFGQGTNLVARLTATGNAKQAKDIQVALTRYSALDIQQDQLYEQFTRVLTGIAHLHPLILVFDDLQWTDVGSANLLFHLGREMKGHPVLVLGAYRPEEIVTGRDGERHPLQKSLAEFKRLYGDVWLHLDRTAEAEKRCFIDAIIDVEPNELDETFRSTLLKHTEGQPLFTVELLRDLQERGDLIWEEDVGWCQNPQLAWDQIPARVEGIIDERVGRLEDELREMLTIASVEGEDFTAQVLARVKEVADRHVIRRLNEELDRRHRLVGEQGTTRLRTLRLMHYRFRHTLFQQHLYKGLNESERQLLHEDVGRVLETLYGDESMSIAPQLAWHFSAADLGEKAIPYLLEAGDRARIAYAYREAARHYRQAIGFLSECDDGQELARTYMRLGLVYQGLQDHQSSARAFEKGFTLWQQATPQPRLGLDRIADQCLYLKPRTLSGSTLRDPDDWLQFIHTYLYSGLVAPTSEQGIEPDLAQSWDILDDGCTYVFHLNPQARWSDGNPLTAYDFQASWFRILVERDATSMFGDPELLYDVIGAEAYHKGIITDAAEVGIEALNEQTLRIRLRRGIPHFLHLLASKWLYPCPQHCQQTYHNLPGDPRKLVSSGPFEVESWQEGREIILSRNPYYCGRSDGNVGTVRIDISYLDLSDWRAYMDLYENDELHVLDMTVFSDAGLIYATRRHGGEFLATTPTAIIAFGFDLHQPPLDDVRVRKAIAMTYDRQTACTSSVRRQYWLMGQGGGLIPPGLPGFSADNRLPFDPVKARRLLAEAGYENGVGFPKLEFHCIRDSRDSEIEWMNIIHRQWQKHLGIDVRHRFESEDMPFTASTLPIFFVVWRADYPDPYNFLGDAMAIFKCRSGWSNPEFDSLVEAGKLEKDPQRRIELYRQADQLLIGEAPLYVSHYVSNLLLVKPWISHFPISPFGQGGILKDVIIEAH